MNVTQRPAAHRRDTARGTRDGVILLYHRVADAATDPQLLCVSPSHFRDQLAELTRSHAVMSLSELVDRTAAGEVPERAVAVTFDDGYADNLTNAAPLLGEFSVPATVFVASGYIGDEREFWWDTLERVLLRPGTLPKALSLRVGDVERAWNLDGFATYAPADFERHRRWSVVDRNDPTPRHRTYRELFDCLRPMKPVDRNAAIEQMTRRFKHSFSTASHVASPLVGDDGTGSTPPTRGDATFLQRAVTCDSKYVMTPDQLRRLAGEPLIEIGGHTVNHPVLSALTVNEQRSEITQCKMELETLIEQPVTSFSYPFGGQRDYTPETVALVREAGFARCCSNFEGRLTGTDAFQLPRMLVRDWDGRTLLQRIAEVAHVG